MKMTFSAILKNDEVLIKEQVETLGRLAPELLKPSRLPRVHKDQPNVPAFFWMSQLRQLVWYESRLEMVALKQLDFSRRIDCVIPQPFVLHYSADGKTRRHIPDFLVGIEGGGRLLMNVKPARYVHTRSNQRAFAAASQLATHLNWDYSTQSEPPAVFLANLSWLAGYRRRPPMFPRYAAALIAAAEAPLRLGDLVSDVGTNALVRPVLFHLIWRRQLGCDLDGEVLNDGTLIHAARN